MSRAERGRNRPRAMIHRRILDVAETNPEASLTAIADEVSGASPDLVERVLDEYGDPGRETESDAEQDQPMDATNASQPQPESEPEPDAEDQHPSDAAEQTGAADDGGPSDGGAQKPDDLDLSEKQRRTLRALYDRPTASQGDLAEQLDVTRATVSRRLNAIPGFEWDDRRAFAESVFGGTAGSDAAATDEGATSDEASADERTSGDSDPDGSDPEAGDDAGSAEDAGRVDDPEPSNAAEGAPRANGGQASSGGDEATEVGQDALDAIGATLANLEHRVAAVESETTGTESEAGGGPSLPPELAHKVVHACMESDRLTEDEELDVLRAFMER